MFFTANGSRRDPFLEILQYNGQGVVWRRLREGNEREEAVHVRSGSTYLSSLLFLLLSLSLPQVN